jgi:hypothetical protein
LRGAWTAAPVRCACYGFELWSDCAANWLISNEVSRQRALKAHAEDS